MANGSKEGESFSFIHAETLIEGTVHARGRLRVDGTVRGSVTVDGTLDVAPGGRIEGGSVAADRVRVAGTIVANVEATATVEIWRDGVLEGDVRAAALDVEEGATFQGRSERTGQPASERSSAGSGRKVTVEAKDPFDAPGMGGDGF